MDAKFNWDDWERFKKEEKKMPNVRIAVDGASSITTPVKKAEPENVRIRGLKNTLLPLTEEFSPKEILEALAQLSYEKGNQTKSELTSKAFKNQALRYRLTGIISNNQK